MRYFRLSLIALLILILAVVPLGGCMPASEDEAWKDKYETLQIEHTILKGKLGSAQADLTYLRDAVKKVGDDYDNLKAEYNTLKADHASFTATSKKLQGEYDSLKVSYNTLQANYNTVKADYDSLKVDYDALKTLYDDVCNKLAEAEKTSLPAPTPTPTTTPTSMLKKGQYLIAQDDTYLGILDSAFATKSIFNDFGSYGSKFSSTSIWNEFGKYGSSFSSLSAFNDLASKPPMLFDGDTFVCYVTTNAFKMPRVSPYSLIAFAESMGWE